IAEAVTAARRIAPGKPAEGEVESLDELEQALAAGVDIVMLDELSPEDMRPAVGIAAGRATLDASGGIADASPRTVAGTGVGYIAIGARTKHVRAIDLSMRLQQ